MLRFRFDARSLHPFVMWGGITWGVAGCGEPQEAEQIEIVLETDADQLRPVTTNLGYTVTLTEARIMVRDLTFATGGELITRSFLQQSYDWLVPVAHAHPGHHEGGDVTGELSGRRLLDWLPGDEHTVGSATFLEGSYNSANLTFCRATTQDLTQDDDALLDHTAIFRGTAQKGETILSFDALLDLEEDTPLTGVPFEAYIDATVDERLHLQLRTQGQSNSETLFDDLDFAELRRDETDHVSISPEYTDEADALAHSTLKSALLAHDHYEITLRP